MRLKITNPAKLRIKEIYDYYIENVSQNIARKIVKILKSSPKKLLKNPNMGQIEENLKHLNKGHRYLVEGNYKIIYRIENNIIYITDFFDTRQDVNKIMH